MTARSIAELEAAIVAAPDDLALRQVYADALQEQADPRGEHIALAFLTTDRARRPACGSSSAPPRRG
jgi:uncharacterized protein (TIGR02996 family)